MWESCGEDVPLLRGASQKPHVYLPHEPEMTLYFRFTGRGAGRSCEQATQAFPERGDQS